MTLTQRIVRPLAATAALALLATGCGGDGGGRPSVDELSESIQSGDMIGSDIDENVADCIAEAFHESDLSDDALQAIVDQDEDYEASEEDEKALESVSTESLTDCVSEGMDMPDLEDPEAS